jgi:hypothetical protein
MQAKEHWCGGVPQSLIKIMHPQAVLLDQITRRKRVAR